jgi:hypothetical protein
MSTEKRRLWRILVPVIIFLILSVPYFRNRGYCYCCFWTHYRHYPIFGRDFAGLYYYYGSLYRAGFINVYDEAMLYEYVKSHGQPIDYFGPPNYPPIMYVLHIPFSLLSKSNAIAAAFILSHLWLFLSLLLLNLLFRKRNGMARPLFWTLAMYPFALAFSPVIENLMSGQINIFLLFLLSLFLFLLCSGRKAAACIVLGLAINVKLFPLCILFYFMIRREWLMCVMSLGSIVLFNVPLLFLTDPVRLVACYAMRLAKLSGSADEFIWQSLPTSLIRMFHLMLSPAQMLMFGKAVFISMIIIIVMIMYYMNRRLKADDRFGTIFLITLALHIFFSGFYYVAPIHHAPMLIFFVALFHAVRERRIDSVPLILCSILVFLGMGYYDSEIDVTAMQSYMRTVLLSKDAGFLFVIWSFLLNTAILYILGKTEPPKLPHQT